VRGVERLETDEIRKLAALEGTHWWYRERRALLARALRRLAKAGRPPGTALDIGAAGGGNTRVLRERGWRAVAVEYNADGAELTRQRGLDVVRADARCLPFSSASLDLVVAFDVLEHIEDDRAALAQWVSWLRQGGTLVLSVPARMSLWTAGDEWAGHFRRYERDALKALVEAAGLRIERFECYGFPLTNITEKASAPLYRRAIHARSGSREVDRQRNNDRSGTDRRLHMRMFNVMRSWFGTSVMRMFYGVQSLFLQRDIGSGYILLARVP